MADYCTTDDVKDNLKDIDLDANTVVPPTVLADIVTQVSALIDVHIQGKYTLPITDTTALSFLELIAIDISVYRVTKILQVKNALPVPSGNVVQDISHGSAYREAMNMLKGLLNGVVDLPNEAPKNNAVFSTSTTTDNDAFVIQKGEEQW
ncbi:MAG: DUF1320 family protein [Gammaproteobacteria bacterium]|nr:DUF1320 family protein [Gammaproteobacteria bacterium]